MPRLGMEPWQEMFHDQWDLAQEKRNASVPDHGDWYLYDGGDEDADS
jgi:hypothetical protein